PWAFSWSIRDGLFEEQQDARSRGSCNRLLTERKRGRKVRQAGLLPTKDVTLLSLAGTKARAPEDRTTASRPRRDLSTSSHCIGYFFLGTFLPFFRALESAMAMACFRLFTLPALPPLPLFAFPR